MGSLESCLVSVSDTVKDFNLCLRPQYASSRLSETIAKYKEISLYRDPYYGECYAIHSAESDVTKVLSVEDGYQNNFAQRSRFWEQLQDECPNVIRTAIIDHVIKRGFMWVKYDLYLLHDFILIDLEKEFDHRLSCNKIFTEDEIKTILKETTRGLQRLQLSDYRSLGMRHIYFCNKGEQIKLAHPKLFRYRPNLQLLCDDYSLKGIYLAPQELAALEILHKEANYGAAACSFTLGMILLSLMSMKHLDEFYSYRKCTIDTVKIGELTKQMVNKYSYKLGVILEGLLTIKSDKRMSIRTVMGKLDKRIEEQEAVEITLLHQQPEESLKIEKPLKENKPSYTNYLSGLIHPKVKLTGEYFHLKDQDDDHEIIANQRLRHVTEGNQYGYFVGGGEAPQSSMEGRGLYKCANGQLYIGQWKHGKMEGFGKLYYRENQLRYEGEFAEGMFEGEGVEYSEAQNAEREDEIDEFFVRLSKGSWLRYEGTYRKDVKEGAGKVHFRKGLWAGNFKQGQPNGEGVFTPSNGTAKAKGVWKDGEQVSKY